MKQRASCVCCFKVCYDISMHSHHVMWIQQVFKDRIHRTVHQVMSCWEMVKIFLIRKCAHLVWVISICLRYILCFHTFTSREVSTAVSVHHVLSCQHVMSYWNICQVIICIETTHILLVLFQVALRYIHAFTSRDVNTKSFQRSNS